MVTISKFLKRISSLRKLRWKTTESIFQRGLSKNTGERASNNLVYGIHFVPESNKKEEVTVHLIERKTDTGFHYVYSWNGKKATLIDGIRRNKLKELSRYKYLGKGGVFYPVLDIGDKSIQSYKSHVIYGNGPLWGKKEVVIELPDETFNKLKYDILHHANAMRALKKIKSTIKGKEVKMYKPEKIFLINAINVLKQTRGRALVSHDKLTEDELELVESKINKYFKEHPASGRTFLNMLGDHLSKIEDIDTATARLYEFFKSNGIRVRADQIRVWIEQVKR